MRIPGWPSINPADLRHSIQIQAVSTTQDGYGQPLTTWTTVLTVNAGIADEKILELFQAGALTSQGTHHWILRYPANVSIQAGMRVVFGPHYYKIQGSFNPGERNVLLFLACLEINANE